MTSASGILFFMFTAQKQPAAPAPMMAMRLFLIFTFLATRMQLLFLFLAHRSILNGHTLTFRILDGHVLEDDILCVIDLCTLVADKK